MVWCFLTNRISVSALVLFLFNNLKGETNMVKLTDKIQELMLSSAYTDSSNPKHKEVVKKVLRKNFNN